MRPVSTKPSTPDTLPRSESGKVGVTSGAKPGLPEGVAKRAIRVANSRSKVAASAVTETDVRAAEARPVRNPLACAQATTDA